MRSKVAVTKDGRQVLRGDLEFDARQQLTADTCAAITSAGSAGTVVTLDCRAVDCASAIEESVIGMLVALGRAANRSGLRLVLAHASKPMRAQLDAAGVAQFFAWKR
jgi:anti-anti-sigma regulatory factor